jgi:hypothetical protein
VSQSTPTTTFVSRGRLSGVLRHRPGRPLGRGQAPRAIGDLDTQEYEAVYYRARLILGDDLPRPARVQPGGAVSLP